jgi:hypothetical protein
MHKRQYLIPYYAGGKIFELYDKYHLYLILKHFINNGVQTPNFFTLAASCEELNSCYADTEWEDEGNCVSVLKLRVISLVRHNKSLWSRCKGQEGPPLIHSISLVTSAEAQKAWVYTSIPRTASWYTAKLAKHRDKFFF